MIDQTDRKGENINLEAAEHFATPEIITPEIFDLIVSENNLQPEETFQNLEILAFSRSNEGSKIRNRYIGNEEKIVTSFYLDDDVKRDILNDTDNYKREEILLYMTKFLEQRLKSEEKTTHFEVAQEIVNLFNLKSSLFELRGIPDIEMKENYLEYILKGEYQLMDISNYDENSCDEFEDYIAMKIQNLEGFITDDSIKLTRENALTNIQGLIFLKKLLDLTKNLKNPKESIHLTKNSKNTFSVYSYIKNLAYREGNEAI